MFHPEPQPSHTPTHTPSHLSSQPQKNLFDMIPSKTAFWIGFATAVLSLCTVGFIVLGSCLLNNNCSFPSGDSKDDAVAAAPSAAAPTAAQQAAAAAAAKTTVDVSKIAAVDKEDHIRGDEKAVITMIEYSDFECPFCDRFHPTIKKVAEEYDGKVRWIYRHFPLSFHEEAQGAAEASECAAEQGKFWEYSDKLFENQTDLGADLYKKLATDLGLNTAQFDTCLSSDKYLAHITTDESEGAAAGVTGTPGTFIFKTDAKGTDQAIIIKGAQSASALKSAIDSLLK